MTEQPDTDAQLEVEREEAERVFGAQARLFASVTAALAGDSPHAERPAGDTYTCEQCLAEVAPTDALTATWVERRMRAAAFDWRFAGTDYIATACATCRDDVVDAVAERGAGQAEFAAAEWKSVSDTHVVTYAHGTVDWPGDDAG